MLRLNNNRIREFSTILKRLKIPLDTFSDERYFPSQNEGQEIIAHYMFFMVAIDHRTSRPDRPFEGMIEGEFEHGADALYRLAMLKFRDDPDFFTPKRMKDISISDVKKWLTIKEPKEITIPDPEIRTFLLRDAANKLNKLYNGSLLDLINDSKGYLYSELEGGFIERLHVFRAYEDPVEKKSFLLAKFLERRNILIVKDKDNASVPVDNHLIRIAVRIGLVDVDKSIEKYFVAWENEADRYLDILIRLPIRRSYEIASKMAGLSPFALDDLLWMLGRKICIRDSPRCDEGVIKVMNIKSCPFRDICEAYTKKEKLSWNEHYYYNTWYY